ncbi:glutathione-dependent formaldehyde-activating enzyme [Trichoderma arundinaceum]|uniref:Glutathione-dependent formaldehyde-activating enzyme n=1 Tax=Trichoderma arundinaceum TaxID=490622 RepID=A0A395NWX4_TRIAR|nr:glutathione-dependent formaldehyde-activating enzyme [Trichoderma arundinaceum]
MTEAETITYRGNCHCGDFVFETKLPEIKSAFHCDCSICKKKGYLWFFPGKDNVNIIKGKLEDLTTYEFGPKKLKHLFCPKCSTAVAGSSEFEQDDLQLALNAHAVQGLACWDLERTPYDGVSRGEPYQPPAHKGELPKVGEGEALYKGSCHCGAVTIAAATKPLDETYAGVIECNCSICERVNKNIQTAALWIYTANTSVILSGDEANIGKYQFNNRILHKAFCKICGVVLTNTFNDISDEEVAALPEKTRNLFINQRVSTGVNARVLEGVDLAKLKRKRVDGLNKIPGDYVNP